MAKILGLLDRVMSSEEGQSLEQVGEVQALEKGCGALECGKTRRVEVLGKGYHIQLGVTTWQVAGNHVKKSHSWGWKRTF